MIAAPARVRLDRLAALVLTPNAPDWTSVEREFVAFQLELALADRHWLGEFLDRLERSKLATVGLEASGGILPDDTGLGNFSAENLVRLARDPLALMAAHDAVGELDGDLWWDRACEAARIRGVLRTPEDALAELLPPVRRLPSARVLPAVRVALVGRRFTGVAAPTMGSAPSVPPLVTMGWQLVGAEGGERQVALPSRIARDAYGADSVGVSLTLRLHPRSDGGDYAPQLEVVPAPTVAPLRLELTWASTADPPTAVVRSFGILTAPFPRRAALSEPAEPLDRQQAPAGESEFELRWPD